MAAQAAAVNPQYHSQLPTAAVQSACASMPGTPCGHAGLYGWGAATMGDGTVIIGDIWNHRVVHFDKTGNNLGVVLTTTGGFNPYGLAVNPSTETIYVGSSQCCEVQVWAPVAGVYTQQPSIVDKNFHYPSRLTVANDGDVFVADMLKNEIFIFDTTGKEIGTFGSNGTHNGQFKQPRGIAFDNASPQHLFVMDSFNFRVDVLTRTGTSTLTYLTSFGGHGTAPGQFIDDNTRGLAIDRTNGWLYAVDTDANVVQKYDINNVNSTTPPAFLPPNIGGNGRNSNPVCCTTPAGLFSDGGRENAVDGNGNLWVGDMPNFRVQVFKSDGTFLFSSPSPAQLPQAGAFSFPQGVAVDSSGNVVVTDSHNQRLQKFSPSGTLLWQGGRRGRFDTYAFAYSQETATDPNDGSIIVADTYNNFIKKFSANGTAVWQIGTSNCGTGQGQFCHPYGVAVGPDSRVYVTDTHNQRVEVFSPAGAFQSTFTDGGIKDPRGIGIDQSNGNIYVANFVGKSILVFNNAGTLLQTITNPEFAHPWDVQVDSSYIYLTDNGDNTIKVLNKSDGSLLATFGGSGGGNGQMRGPEGLSLAPGGVVWVADTLNDRLESWCVTCAGPTSPTYVRTIGQPGQAQMYPSGLAVDASGNIAVADTGNDTVEYFNSGTSTPFWTAGIRGATIGGAPDSFENPRDVAMDATYVYVADTENQIVQVLKKSDGSYVRTMNFTFNSAYGISVGTDGAGHERILVSDSFNGKVYVFDTSDNLTLTIPPTTPNASTRDAATDSSGNIYTADYRNDRIDKYDAKGNPLPGWGGATAPTCQQVPRPFGVDVDSTGNVYVASSNLDVVKEFKGVDGTCQNNTSGTTNVFGQKGTGAQQLYQLRRVAVGPGATPLVYAADLWGLKVLTYNADGTVASAQPELGNGVMPAAGGLNEAHGVAVTSTNVFVTDTVNQRMQRFNLDGTSPLAWTIGVPETPTGLNWPEGVGVNAVSGNVWVADTRNNVIDEFTPGGTATGRTVSAGSVNFNRPTAVSFDTAGNMYVADTNNDQIVSFAVTSTTITFRWAEGTSGSGAGNFSRPGDVTYDATQSTPRLLVADTRNSRIVALDPATGAWLKVLAMTKGSSVGQVLMPQGVTVGLTGMIWVADTGNNRIQEFNPDGTTANELVGGYGTSNGQFNAPQSIQAGPDGLIYVGDTSNNRVQVYQPV